MAVLSSLTTDKRLSFTKYVVENKRLAEIDFEIESKLEGSFYTKKGSNWVLTATLKAGEKFKIIDTKLYEMGKDRLAKVKYKSKEGFIPINKIRKPTGGNGTQYEDEVVDAINAYILEAGGKVNFKIGSKVYKDMAYCIKVDTNIKRMGGASGDPKADIIICADKRKPLAPGSIYISHKKTGGPEAFQQYGGISEKSGEKIYNNKIVQEFLKKTAMVIGDRDQLPGPVMMEFTDKTLMNMSIFGPDYGGDFSIEHVQLIGQGNPVFNAKRDYTELDFSSHMSLSGDLSHFTGGYQPVLGGTFRAGRSFVYKGKRYTGARLGIYPKKLIAGRGGLITL